MGLVTPGVPEKLVADLISHIPIRTFVELGTFKGDTARWASRNFQSVVTVEASEAFYSHAQKRLAALKNVNVLFGDSRQVLPGVCEALSEPAIFWLDSHWSGGRTAGADDECPLLDELRIILAEKVEHVLLIDDARFFLCAPCYPLTPEKWPTISDIVGIVKQFRDRFDLCVIDDVIVISPPQLQSVIQSYCQRRCTIMDWRLGSYLKFLHRSSLWNLLQLGRVLGGVVLKKTGLLPELSDRVIREAPERFGYADD